jgi:hypothetical protein
MQRAYIESTLGAMGVVSAALVPHYAELFLERPATADELREFRCSEATIARYIESVQRRNGPDAEKRDAVDA